MVEVGRFERPTTCTQNTHSSQIELHLENWSGISALLRGPSGPKPDVLLNCTNACYKMICFIPLWLTPQTWSNTSKRLSIGGYAFEIGTPAGARTRINRLKICYPRPVRRSGQEKEVSDGTRTHNDRVCYPGGNWLPSTLTISYNWIINDSNRTRTCIIPTGFTVKLQTHEKWSWSRESHLGYRRTRSVFYC